MPVSARWSIPSRRSSPRNAVSIAAQDFGCEISEVFVVLNKPDVERGHIC
jgi:hypothetical protein